jgi:hypothetical protein
MQIYISEDAIIANIQNDFQRAYPYLRLEFYRQTHEAGRPSFASDRIPVETPIDDIRMLHTFGWIDISPNRTAVELEYDFRHMMGLNVQVLRKSGSLCLETTKTDTWPLARLNEESGQEEQYTYVNTPPKTESL